MLLIKGLIYHQHSRLARTSKNKSGSGLTLQGVGLLGLMLINHFIRKNIVDSLELGILTSPTVHTRRAVEKLTPNMIYIGKGHITRYYCSKLSFSELRQIIDIALRRRMRIIESIAIYIELKCILGLLDGLKLQRIYITNYIDRYAYMLSQYSKQNGIELIVIPHGRVMHFDISYKYDVSKLVYSHEQDLIVSRSYFRIGSIEFLEEENPHEFKNVNKDVIAFYSSANLSSKYYWFLMKLIWDFRDKEIWVYPHPREKMAYYKLLKTLRLINLPRKRVLNASKAFSRLSSVSVDLFERNRRSVVFLNFENRDTKDFPKNSVILKNIREYASRID